MSGKMESVSLSVVLDAEDRSDLLRAMLKMLGHALTADARLADMDAKELHEYVSLMQRVA